MLPHLPRFGDRLLSLGMVLSLVLGVGGLLVPTFSGMRDPLEIPLIARPHERGPRLAFYAAVMAALIAAFALEIAGLPSAGAIVRALAGSAILMMVWKLPRGPGRGDLSAYAMWGDQTHTRLFAPASAASAHHAKATGTPRALRAPRARSRTANVKFGVKRNSSSVL